MYIQLNYAKNSVISDNAGNSTFKITKTELSVPAVTLKTEDNNKLNRLLDTEFKRMNTNDNVGNPVGDPPVAPDDNNIFKRNSHRKYFLPRVDIKDYNVLMIRIFLMILKNTKN